MTIDPNVEANGSTYTDVVSDSGGCPQCGGIDHRYVQIEAGVVYVTRSCDEHRLEWIVGDDA